MARLSNTPLDEKTYRQILDTLDLVLGKMKKEEVRSLLFSLFGKSERIMVSKRFAAVLLLNRGMTIAEISRRLKLTRQTIVRLNMIKELKGQGFLLALKRVNQSKMTKEINQILVGLAKGSAEVFLKHKVKLPNDFPAKNR